jgi:hypothetical protein
VVSKSCWDFKAASIRAVRPLVPYSCAIDGSRSTSMSKMTQRTVWLKM